MPAPQDNLNVRPTVSALRAGATTVSTVRPAVTAVTTESVAAVRMNALASGDASQIEHELALRPVAVQNFSTTFNEVRQQGPAKAAAFSVTYAQTLQTNDQVGQFFQQVAMAPQTDRVTILEAQKAAGLGQAVVHGVALLPSAQGRAIMQDFLLRAGQLDEQAMGSVMEWVTLAGRAIRERGLQIPDVDAPHDGIFDDIWDAVTDVAGAIADAVKAVVDSVINVVGGIIEGLKQIANWAADKVKDLVNGLLAAGHSIAELVSDALQASAAALKKIL